VLILLYSERIAVGLNQGRLVTANFQVAKNGTLAYNNALSSKVADRATQTCQPGCVKMQQKKSSFAEFWYGRFCKIYHSPFHPHTHIFTTLYYDFHPPVEN